MNLKAGYALVPAFIYCITANAQQVKGRLFDPDTQQPVVNAHITTSIDKAQSDLTGHFNIKAAEHDTLKISATGYDLYMLPINGLAIKGPITVLMHNIKRMLNTVNIYSRRDRVLDSIKKRQEYAGVFNYKSPTLKDVFTAPPSNVPFAFVTIDLLKLVNVIDKKNDPKNKLKQVLERDEHAEYINSRYNKTVVSRITGLQGDTLLKFTDKYYPTYEWLKRTSDYDLIIYIKSKAGNP